MGLIASGDIKITHLGSGAVGSGVIGSGAIGSGVIASGAIGRFHLSSGALVDTNLASGTTITQASVAGGQPLVSGTAASQPLLVHITSEVVSGQTAVYLNQSGQIGVAMASVSGRWPAVGVAMQNALSGLTIQWAQVGSLQFSSGMVDFSGFIGRRAWLGRSGNIVTISGALGSGGWASGDVGQPIGIVANSGAIYFNVLPGFWSGGPLGFAAGGMF